MKRYFPNPGGNQVITPEVAGWQYSGLAIFSIKPGEFELPDELFRKNEAALISLNGESFEVKVDGKEFTVRGRPGVFAGATDWVYVAPCSKVVINSKKKL